MGMGISGEMKFSEILATYSLNKLPRPLPSLCNSKVGFGDSLTGMGNMLRITPKFMGMQLHGRDMHHHYYTRCSAIMGNKIPTKLNNQQTEGLLLDAIKMNFFERLNLAWKILFPPTIVSRNSNANIAKQRLKMILFSDRCAVSEQAKQKIVNNIVGALSDFVEIDSGDKVQLSVLTDPDLGTVYSVTVPVRRVKPAYQERDQEYHGITSVEYKDTGEESGSVDVRFDFYVPNESSQ